MRRSFLLLIALVLALVATGMLAYQWMDQPTVLRVAVGPVGSEDTRVVVAAGQYLARERQSIRLKLVLTDGVLGSAEALEQDKVDLAVVRSDVNMPTKGQTIAIMHRDAAVLLAREGSSIGKIADLKNHTIGIVRGTPGNQLILDSVLAHYEVPHPSVTVVLLASAAEVEEAVRTKKVDAVLAAGTLTGKTVTETVSAVTRAGGGAPVFIPVGEADAIAQRLPVYESIEIVRGAFGGTPPRPNDAVTTMGFTHRLVGKASLDENMVSELTRLLFAMRPTLTSEAPLAARIEAPDTAKGSTLPVHPGAAAYYDGEVQTFMDRYGDWLYFIAMMGSVAGSGIVGLASIASNRRHNRTMARLEQLLDIVRRARKAESEEELDTLIQESDEVLAHALNRASDGRLSAEGLPAFTLAFDQVKSAIVQRQHALQIHARDKMTPPLRDAAE